MSRALALLLLARHTQPTKRQLQGQLLALREDPSSVELTPELGRFIATRCGAMTRKGTPCRCKGMKNGRCRLHGGMSTGPRTPEGRLRALRNLKQFRAGPSAAGP